MFVKSWDAGAGESLDAGACDRCVQQAWVCLQLRCDVANAGLLVCSLTSQLVHMLVLTVAVLPCPPLCCVTVRSSGHAEHTHSASPGQTQYGGQNFSGTSATMNWGIRDIPTPKEMVAALDEWVVGQPAAKKVGSAEAGCVCCVRLVPLPCGSCSCSP